MCLNTYFGMERPEYILAREDDLNRRENLCIYAEVDNNADITHMHEKSKTKKI